MLAWIEHVARTSDVSPILALGRSPLSESEAIICAWGSVAYRSAAVKNAVLPPAKPMTIPLFIRSEKVTRGLGRPFTRNDVIGGHAFCVSESTMRRDSGRGVKGRFRFVLTVYLLPGGNIKQTCQLQNVSIHKESRIPTKLSVR